MSKVKFKSVLTGIAATAVIAAGPAIAVAKTDNGNSNAHNNVTICHATGSKTNPYVKITPNVNGIISGHQNHQDQNDIIPPFSYNDHGTTKSFPGQNWDSNGQAIFNNGCKKPSSQSGGTPSPNNQNQQVLGANAGAGATAAGGVNAGAGGASSFSTNSLQRAW